MAHELAFFTDGRARMAYVGQTPWHGLGQVLTPNAPLEVWAKEAGLDFEIKGSPVAYKTESGKTFAYGKKQVLYRADTDEALSVVGDKYKVHQPMEVLEFFRDLVADQGFQLETAGVLFNGAKYWALANTGQEVRIKGQDVLKGYLMLATACDGTMRTVARRTSVRVVCNNTLEMSSTDAASDVKVSHSSVFDANKIKEELGLMEKGWNDFAESAKVLADIKVTNQQAVDFVIKLLGDSTKPVEAQPNMTNISKVLQLFDGQGKGSDLKSSQGTAWGLVNAVTEMVDWHKGRDQNRRLEAAWFYSGNDLKTRAFNEAMLLAA